MKLFAAILVLAAMFLAGDNFRFAPPPAADACCCASCPQAAQPSDCGCPPSAPCAKLPVADASASDTLPRPLSSTGPRAIPADESSNARTDAPPTPPPRAAA